MNKLLGKSVIITGANQGFGLEVAKTFAAEGANLVLCARNVKKLIEAKEEIESVQHEGVKVLFRRTDISNAGDLNGLVEFTIDKLGSIDVLIANAGIYGPKGPIEEISWNEWSEAIDINLKGTVLSCISVISYMKKAGKGKIIILSGGGATKPMPNLSAYAVSKAGVVRFAETLALELLSYNIDVNSIAPGALNTRLLEEILEAGPEKIGLDFYNQAVKQKETGGIPLEKGAILCTFLASDESNGITGKLISAIWDNWESWPNHLNELQTSDVYTLRRIAGRDRNFNWGDK